MYGTFYKIIIAQNHPKKGKTKTEFDELNHKAFSVSPMHACEVRKRGKRHKGKFHFVKEYSSGMGHLLGRMTGDQQLLDPIFGTFCPL